MGYRSDVCIGLSKQLYAKAVLLDNIPKCLSEVTRFTPERKENSIYWLIEGWKWYDSYPEIQEIEAWFDWCIEEGAEDIDPHFGAIRLGEAGDDVTEWGHPWGFDLYINRSINLP